MKIKRSLIKLLILSCAAVSLTTAQNMSAHAMENAPSKSKENKNSNSINVSMTDAQSTAAKNMSSKSMSSQSMPSQSTAAKSTASQSTASKSMSSKSMPSQSTASQSTASQSTASKSMSSKSMPSQSMAVKSMSSKSMPSKSTASQSMSSQSTAANSTKNAQAESFADSQLDYVVKNIAKTIFLRYMQNNKLDVSFGISKNNNIKISEDDKKIAEDIYQHAKLDKDINEFYIVNSKNDILKEDCPILLKKPNLNAVLKHMNYLWQLNKLNLLIMKVIDFLEILKNTNTGIIGNSENSIKYYYNLLDVKPAVQYVLSKKIENTTMLDSKNKIISNLAEKFNINLESMSDYIDKSEEELKYLVEKTNSSLQMKLLKDNIQSIDTDKSFDFNLLNSAKKETEIYMNSINKDSSNLNKTQVNDQVENHKNENPNENPFEFIKAQWNELKELLIKQNKEYDKFIKSFKDLCTNNI